MYIYLKIIIIIFFLFKNIININWYKCFTWFLLYIGFFDIWISNFIILYLLNRVKKIICFIYVKLKIIYI